MKPFEISRTFPADIQKVFEAWSMKDHLIKWWCPPEFSIYVKKFEFKPGGIFHYSISSLEGWPLWGKFVFGLIIPNERIEFINSFSDENENIVRAPFSDTWPLEIHSKVLFQPFFTGETLLSFTSHPLNSNEEEQITFESNFENLKTGFGGTLNQLNHFLQN